MCWSMFTLSISTHHLGCFVAGLVLWQHAPLVDLLNHVDMFHTHVLQAHHNHVHSLHVNLLPPPIPDMSSPFSWKGCTGTVLRKSCFFLTWLRKCKFTLKIIIVLNILNLSFFVVLFVALAYYHQQSLVLLNLLVESDVLHHLIFLTTFFIKISSTTFNFIRIIQNIIENFIHITLVSHPFLY